VTQAKSAVVVGAQWGDEGKGKIVDVLSERFSVVARYAGGHNAGHTVIINGQKFILQLVPCGVLRPGCRGVIGNGVVLDPMAFLKETGRLRDLGIDVDSRLFVSNRAQDDEPGDWAGVRGQDGAQRAQGRRSAEYLPAEDAY
jgi:adenylosuccinate synthase